MNSLKQISLSLLTAGALLMPAFALADNAAMPNQKNAPSAAAFSARDAQKEVGPLRKMIANLNLSQQQNDQINKLISDAQPTFAKLREQDKATKQKLADQGFKYNSDVQKLADEEGKNVSNRIVEGAKLRAAIYDVLTPEQKKQVDTWQQQRNAEKAAREANKPAK